MAWKGLELYHDVTTFIDKLMKNGEEEEVEDEPEDVSKNILSYTTHDGKMASLSSIPPITDLLFFKEKIDGKIYCRRISVDDDITNLSLMPLKKQFIQVEFKYDNKSVDIHEHLQQFYLKDNHLQYCQIAYYEN